VDDSLSAEADAFNRRINERQSAGFVPDLERITENEYFYKSFWRDPFYADLYVGTLSRSYIRYFRQYIGQGASILDVGCGPGYFSLELARQGFNVVGIDISAGAVDAAKGALAEARLGDDFGSLSFFCGTLQEFLVDDSRTFDGILSSGFLHHIPNLGSEVRSFASALKPGGVLVMHEPQHLQFTEQDAFWVATMRLLLSRLKAWYEDYAEVEASRDFHELVVATHQEFVLERDISEPLGQSPNDLSADRDAILQALETHFSLLEVSPSRSFIYRTLGGLRGSGEMRHDLATLLSLIDSVGVERGYLNANYFYAVAQKND